MIEPHRIAAHFFNRPLLLTPTSARTIGSFILSRFDARKGGGGDDRPIEEVQGFRPQTKEDGSVVFHSPRSSRFVGEYRSGPDGRPTPYRVTQDGTAIISIIGELVNRGAWIGASSGLVSYEGIRHQLLTAARDPNVSTVLLDLETPGGEAVGAFEVASVVRQVREQKPVLAVVNGMAASAGYAIASGATRIVSIPSGLSGSIGVVMMHLDLSAYLETEGVKPTLIFAGKHKVDGNAFEPLPESVRSAFQADIDQFYGMFVETVAAGRKGLAEQAIRNTEANVYLGADAVRVGLVDEVGTLEDVVADLAKSASGSATAGSSPPAALATAPAPASPKAESGLIVAARRQAQAAEATASAWAEPGARASGTSPAASVSARPSPLVIAVRRQAEAQRQTEAGNA